MIYYVDSDRYRYLPVLCISVVFKGDEVLFSVLICVTFPLVSSGNGEAAFRALLRVPDV
jgi:hypothetical protein